MRTAFANPFPYLPETHLVEPAAFLEFDEEAGFYGDGFVGRGGNLSPGCLLSGYRRGLFPWYTRARVPYWYAPDPRFVLYPERLHLSRSLTRLLARSPFTVTFDTAFEAVISACARVPRAERSTWITPDYRHAFTEMHRLGYAHSAEVWREGRLVGGLYGQQYGAVFFGESMFHLEPNASKVGFATAARRMRGLGVRLIDCQQRSEYMAGFGAEDIPLADFIDMLGTWIPEPVPRTKW